jgi:trehalose synthase
MRGLEDYLPIVGEKVMAELYRNAHRLMNRHIVHINSTAYGGGVAEILNNLIILMNDVGVDTGWRVLSGQSDFFTITKKFHNAIHGQSINMTENKKRLYLEANERFSKFTHLDHDVVVIHDPQPLPLIKFNKKVQPWIWRCHIDLTSPNEDVWNFIKLYILRYDMMILSSKRFQRDDLPIEQKIMAPSIDPLSPKNMDLNGNLTSKVLKKYSIPTDKPLITQVSRFDPWKDPEGVLKVFKRVKQEVDCRLVYCYNMAPDDPEGIIIYNKMKKRANSFLETGDVLFVLGENQILVNVLQRISDVIIQKSLREGFGLTVTEAQWKQTPVVASRVGGIPDQVVDNETGFLVDPRDIDDCAAKVVALLKDKKMAEDMGRKGREFIRNNFLITRQLKDYLEILSDVLNGSSY